MLYIGADHRGFELKEKLKVWLQMHNIPLEDVGAFSYTSEDDYPLIAAALGEKVRESEDNKGILLCGSGIGAVSAVNKVRGIRGGLGIATEQVVAGRHDDDMNVLVLAADYTTEDDSRRMAEAFLKTAYDDGTERYQRRVDQIHALEERRYD
jgi:ribose 5-phosphate isomerase B